MLAYMHAQYTFFHQGFNLLKEIEPQMRSLGKQVGALLKIVYFITSVLLFHYDRNLSQQPNC